MSRPAHDGALEWLLAGHGVVLLWWPVFAEDGPVRCACGRARCPSIGKHPIAQLHPHGLKDAFSATDDGVSKLERGFIDYPDANYGIVTHGLAVLDFDAAKGGLEDKRRMEDEHGSLPGRRHLTGKAADGRRGEHVICRQGGTPMTNRNQGLRLAGYNGVDIRGDGGYIVGPGSMHPSGLRYEVAGGDIEPFPDWLAALVTGEGPTKVSPRPSVASDETTGPPGPGGALEAASGTFDTKAIFQGVAAGGRDDASYRFACSMRAKRVPEPEARARMEEAWRAMEQPPGDEFPLEAALEKVPRAYAKFPEGHSPEFEAALSMGVVKGPTVSTRLIQIAEETHEFFQSQEGQPYALPREGAPVALPLRGSRSFRARLAAAYYASAGKVPNNGALADALTVLEGWALAAPRRKVAVRLAAHEGGVVLDLGDDTGRAVVVRPGAWELVERSPVIFRRSGLTAAIPEPVGGGSLDDMRGLLNIGDEAWSLLVGYMAAAWVPDIPHPVLWFTGEQGVGKTSAMRMIASLLDPSPALTRTAPRDIEAWIVAATDSLVIPVDNVSAIPAWFSDAICRTATGDALIRRQLYTDNDLVINAIQRVVVLNGIGVGSLRGDLGDRLVPVPLERIPDHERRLDREIQIEWDALRPGLVGALLDLLAAVLARLPEVELGAKPRMADFACVLAAVDAVRGTESLQTYLASRDAISEQVVEGDDVAAAVIELVRRRATQATTDGDAAFVGTASELLRQLIPPERPGRDWPRNAQQMAVALSRIAPDLARVGIQSRPPTSHKRKEWKLWLGDA